MLTFFWIFVLIFASTNSNSLDNKTPSRYSEKRRKYVIQDEKIDQIKLLDKKYSSTNWQYNRYCQLYFPLSSTPSRCTAPNKHEKVSCFGQPINYSYVKTENHNVPPSLSFLKKFPSCWKKISPLICAHFYRPCTYKTTTNNQVYIERIRSKSNTSNLMFPTNDEKRNELWQIVPIDSCSQAKKDCYFLEALGLWPSFLDCDTSVQSKMFPSVPANTVEQDFKLFGSQCKLPLKIKSNESTECVWPLVFQAPKNFAVGSAVIDACYLPCRSALITSTVSINSFHMLSLLVSLCFLSFFVYFLPLVKHIEAFVLTQATFWTGIHYFLLSLPFLDSIFEEAVCDGQIRRSVKPVYFSNLKNISLHGLGELVSLCNLQSLLLTFSILCSYYWLTVLLLRQVFFLLQRRNCFLIKLSGRRVNCGWLYSLVYPVAIIYCIVSTAAIETTPNGAIGVCYPALERMKTAAFVLAPILLCLVCLTVAVLSCLFMLITGLFDESFGKKLRHAQPNRCDTYMEPNMTNSKKPLINEEKITNKTENNQASKPSLLPLAHFVLIYTSFWISLLALSFLNHLIYTNSPSEKEAILRSVICSVNAAFSEKLFNSTQESLGDKLYSSSHFFDHDCELPINNFDMLYLLGYLIFPSLPLATASFCILRNIMTKRRYVLEVLCFQENARLPLNTSPTDLVSVSPNCAETVRAPNGLPNRNKQQLTGPTMKIPSTTSGFPVEEPETKEGCESLVVESDANNYSDEHLKAWLQKLLPLTQGGSTNSLNNKARTEVSTHSFRSDPQGMNPRLVREVIDQRDLASPAGSDQTFNMTSASNTVPNRSHRRNETSAPAIPKIDPYFMDPIHAFELGLQSGASIERQLWQHIVQSSSHASSSDETSGRQESNEDQDFSEISPSMSPCCSHCNLKCWDLNNSGNNNETNMDEQEESTEEDTEGSTRNLDASTVVESDFNDDERYPDSDEERMLREELEKHRQRSLNMAAEKP